MAKPFSPGALALRWYYTPLARIRQCLREGGPLGQRRTAAGRSAMEAAAHTLATLSATSGARLELHLLTGKDFWYQTLFCLWTFALHAQRPLSPVIYDDGSLAAQWRAPFRRLFPTVRFVDRAAAVAQLDRYLPTARYPHLRERWLSYPNIRKLIDPHLGSSGWKLVIDSDLLFFRRPDLLVAWLDNPGQPLHAVDCTTSYGYSRPLLDRLAGHPLADLVNVGLTGLRSDEVDWERLEAWTAALHAAEGTSYYLEQALIAMLVADRPCVVAPAADYVTLPRPPETQTPAAVMHHYVANSKGDYFRRCWRLALA